MSWEKRPAGPEAATRSTRQVTARTRRDAVLAEAEDEGAEVDERAEGTTIEARPARRVKGAGK